MGKLRGEVTRARADVDKLRSEFETARNAILALRRDPMASQQRCDMAISAVAERNSAAYKVRGQMAGFRFQIDDQAVRLTQTTSENRELAKEV